MSDFDSNPFADPEAGNPFADPSVRQATQGGQQQKPAGLEEYNPFADQQTQPQQSTFPAPQPAVMPTTQQQQPPPYTPSAAQLASEDLQKKQEELEKKAAELQRKEQELQRNMMGTNRENNFPPLPSFCPVKPCFYQDINVDIPLEFQRIVRIVYYLWLGYVILLFINFVGALAYFIVDGNGGTTFGVSILYLVVCVPCSFVCWYRPLYKAFRSDSSFNFFLFFFIFFFQFCVTVLFAIGINNWGTCGFLNALGVISAGGASRIIVGIIMLVIALLFAVFATLDFVLLVKVHRIYRNTGASFQKAQEEFAQGVMSNRTVQNTAANVGTAAARGAMNNATQGNGGNRF